MSAAVALDFPDSHYSAEMQRFVSEDSVSFAGGDTNLYRYVGSSPLMLTDPSGKFWHVVIGAGIGAIAGYYSDGWQGALAGGTAGAFSSAKFVGAGLSFFINFGSGIIDAYSRKGSVDTCDLAKSLVGGATSSIGTALGGKLFKPGAKQIENFYAKTFTEQFRQEASDSFKSGVGGVSGALLNMAGQFGLGKCGCN